MSKHKTSGKEHKKGSQLVLRVDKAERDAFVTLCDKLDTSAARELRRFMREFVAAHPAGQEAPSEVADVASGEATNGEQTAVVAAERSDAAAEDQRASDVEQPKKSKKRSPK